MRSLDAAARSYFFLAGLALAADCRAAGDLLASAVRLIACLHQVARGDAALTALLSAAIDALPAGPNSDKPWYRHHERLAC